MLLRSMDVAIVSLNDKDNEEILALQQQLHLLKELLKASRNSHNLPAELVDRDKKIAELQHFQRAFEVAQERLRVSDKNVSDAKEAILKEVHLKQQAIDEAKALYHQFDILKERCIAAGAQVRAYEQEKGFWQQQQLQLQQELDSTKEALSESEARLFHYQDDLHEAEKHLEEVSMENQRLQNEATKALHLQEDAEARLKIAHHHLAKKVRESTELSDRLDVQEAKMRALTVELEDLRDAKQESQFLYEQKIEKEKQQQHRLQEALINSENTARDWESKYHELEGRLLESDQRIAQLQDIEEKYRQMQSLWSNFGGYLENEGKAAKNVNSEERESITSYRPYQNLYDTSRPASLPKHPIE